VNISSVAWETPPPATVGSRISFVAHFLGRRTTYTYEVRELVDAERFVMSTAEGPFPMKTTYTWADTPGGGTRMTLPTKASLQVFGQLTAPMMARVMRRANRRDLDALKALLENTTLWHFRTVTRQTRSPGFSGEPAVLGLDAAGTDDVFGDVSEFAVGVLADPA
jgi:hypothetical protein